jgi:cobalamin biosynthesis protein CobD/CbiB
MCERDNVSDNVGDNVPSEAQLREEYKRQTSIVLTAGMILVLAFGAFVGGVALLLISVLWVRLVLLWLVLMVLVHSLLARGEAMDRAEQLWRELAARRSARP